MNATKKTLYNYQLELFNKIYSYIKNNLEKEMKIFELEDKFKIKWIKTFLEIKKEFEKSIKKQTEEIEINKTNKIEIKNMKKKTGEDKKI